MAPRSATLLKIRHWALSLLAVQFSWREQSLLEALGVVPPVRLLDSRCDKEAGVGSIGKDPWEKEACCAVH